MISIDRALCTGCGVCVEACPSGALYLVDGIATLDGSRCRARKECVEACPNGAIVFVAEEVPVAGSPDLPVLRPEPEVVHVRAVPAPVTLRSIALPAFGAALSWAGREILPVVADLVLDRLDRRTTGMRASRTGNGGAPLGRGARCGGRRQRRRRRGRA